VAHTGVLESGPVAAGRARLYSACPAGGRQKPWQIVTGPPERQADGRKGLGGRGCRKVAQQ